MKRIVTETRYEEQGSTRTWACITLAAINISLGLYILLTGAREPVWLYPALLLPGGVCFAWDGWKSYHRRLVIDENGVLETYEGNRKPWQFRWDELDCVVSGGALWITPKDDSREMLRLFITVKDQILPVVRQYAQVREE